MFFRGKLRSAVLQLRRKGSQGFKGDGCILENDW